MNQVIENIKSRRSVKSYKNEMVSDDFIKQIVEAGTYAPSGMNKQSAIIVVVKDKEKRDFLSKLNAKIMNKEGDFDPFYNAPVILVVLARKDVSTNVYDGSVVLQNMMLAAHSLGVDSCWIHRAKEEFETEEGQKFLKSIGIDAHEFIGIGHCILGYRDKDVNDRIKRKDNYIYYA